MRCITCNTKLTKSKAVREYGGIEIKNIDCFRCNKCGEEYFTGEQQRRLESIAKELGVFGTHKMKRKLGLSGTNIIVRLPKEIVEELHLAPGDNITLWKEGKKIIISPT